MGCDIHLYTERVLTKNVRVPTGKFIPSKTNKNKQEEVVETKQVSEWICMDYFQLNPFYDAAQAKEEEEDYYEKPFRVVHLYDSRDYSLFARLADVRNYGDDVFIDQPRGLPEDVTKFIKAESDKWGCDGHSHSWLTLKELKDFHEAHPDIQYAGLVSPEDARKLDEGTGTPKVWGQGTSDPTWVKRTWSVPDEGSLPKLIKLLEEKRDREFWLWPHHEHYKTRIEQEQLDSKIRIVFWFDN